MIIAMGGGQYPFPDNKMVLDITELLPFEDDTHFSLRYLIPSATSLRAIGVLFRGSIRRCNLELLSRFSLRPRREEHGEQLICERADSKCSRIAWFFVLPVKRTRIVKGDRPNCSKQFKGFSKKEETTTRLLTDTVPVCVSF